jgi:GNAT superfamily N-acetyltransferase
MIAATNYVAEAYGEPVCHVAVGTSMGLRSARMCRLVTMPEWQGAGVGMKFLEHIAGLWLEGKNRYHKPMTSIIHTSHPGLIAALRRAPRWILVSQQIGGGDKAKSRGQMVNAARKKEPGIGKAALSGYGGHLRAVAGFRYVGDREKKVSHE